MDYKKDFNCFVATKTGILKGVKANEVKTIAKTLQNIKNLSKESEITALSWGDTDEKEIYMGLADQTVKIYDSESKSFTKSIQAKCGEGAIVGVISTENSMVTASTSGHVGIWTGSKCDIINTGGVLERMRQNPYNRGIFATGGKSNDLKLWDVSTGESNFKAKNVPHNSLQLEVPVWVSDMTFMPDNRNIAVSTRYGQVRLYDPVAQRRPVLNIDIPEKALISIAATPKQGHIVVGTGTGQMYLVDLRKKGLLCGHYKGVTGSIREIACHKSEPYVVSVSLDRHLRVHHCDSRKLLAKVYLQSKLNCLLLREDFNLKEPLLQPEANTDEQEITQLSGNEGSDTEDMNSIFKSMETISEPAPIVKKRKTKIIITGLDKPKKKKRV